MAVYVMSDLHGCMEEFQAMLKKIDFRDLDSLYIIGDVCDRGRQSISLLRFIMENPNMHMILGNHDQWLLTYADALIDIQNNRGGYPLPLDMQSWLFQNGGLSTANEFMDLETPVCYDIKCYLEEVPLYMNLDVHGKSFLLVHAGIPASLQDPDRSISSYRAGTLLWSHIGLNDNPYPHTTMIVGHTPTFHYGDEYTGRIAKGKNNPIYHIDCGCVFGGTLGCLCLDDLREYYVDSTYPKIF